MLSLVVTLKMEGRLKLHLKSQKTFYKVKVLTKEPTLKYVDVSLVVEKLFLEQKSGNTLEKPGSGTFSTEEIEKPGSGTFSTEEIEKQSSGTSSTVEIVISGDQGSLGDTEGE